MKLSNTLMPALFGGLLAAGGLMIAAVPKPETHDASGIAQMWIDERPNEVSAFGLGFEIAWFTIDGGGGTSAGAGGFELSGTIGQHDAGNAGGGAFALSGGYWTATLDATSPVCQGDLNGDGQVDADDLGLLLAAFGSSDAGDINGDGVTDADDLGLLLAAFGDLCD